MLILQLNFHDSCNRKRICLHPFGILPDEILIYRFSQMAQPNFEMILRQRNQIIQIKMYFEHVISIASGTKDILLPEIYNLWKVLYKIDPCNVSKNITDAIILK